MTKGGRNPTLFPAKGPPGLNGDQAAIGRSSLANFSSGKAPLLHVFSVRNEPLEGGTCSAATDKGNESTRKLQADALTDGMKHRQKCERSASVKQMGAKCGNKEATKKKRTHTHAFGDLRPDLMLKRTQTQLQQEG